MEELKEWEFDDNVMVGTLNETYNKIVKASPFKKEKVMAKRFYVYTGRKALLKRYKNKFSFTAEDLLNLCSFVLFTEKTTGYTPLDIPGVQITLKRLGGTENADDSKADMCVLNSSIPTEHGSFSIEIQAYITATDHRGKLKVRWTSSKLKDKAHVARRASEKELEVLEMTRPKSNTAESICESETIKFLNNVFIFCINAAMDALLDKFV